MFPFQVSSLGTGKDTEGQQGSREGHSHFCSGADTEPARMGIASSRQCVNVPNEDYIIKTEGNVFIHTFIFIKHISVLIYFYFVCIVVLPAYVCMRLSDLGVTNSFKLPYGC